MLFNRLHVAAGHLNDAFLLLFVIFLIPVAILAIGAPLALLLRLVIEIAERW